MLYNVKFYNPFAQEDVVWLAEADSEAEAKAVVWAVGCPYRDIDKWPFEPEDYSVWKYSKKPEANHIMAIERVGEELYNKALEVAKAYDEN